MSKKMITPPFVGSFVNLTTPSAPPGTDAPPKYSITIVLPKGDAFWKQVDKAMQEVAKGKWGKVPKGLKLPVKDGDDSDFAEFEDSYTLAAAASEDRRPEVVGTDLQPVMDAKEIYAGAIYRASIRPYAWEHPVGGKGISFGLDNVMKVADGDPLDGRTKAADDFADFASDEDLPEEQEDESSSLLG